MTGILRFIWFIVVYGTCTYLVFWKDASGWWYLLAIVIASGISFKFAEAKR